MAPRNMRVMFSIFLRFQGSCQDAWLAIRRGVLVRMVSTMRRLLARSELPVSVTSTIASASCGGLTSVAPHENSTCACTPWPLR